MNSSMTQQLRDDLRLQLLGSSPEMGETLRAADMLDPHIDQVIEWLQVHNKLDSNGVRQECLQDALARLHSIDHKALNKATSLRDFSDAPEQWANDLQRNIKRTSPEAYAEAVRLNHLLPHANFVAELARAKLRELLTSGRSHAAAMAEAKHILVARATPVLPPPDEYLGNARAARALSASQFAELVERYAVTPAYRQREFASTVMQAILERPEYGSLLDTDYMRFHWGENVLYQYCLAAWHFGSGEIESATSIFEDLVAEEGSDFAYECLANCQRVLKEPAHAIRTLEKGMRAHPDSLSLKYSAAGAYFCMGDVASANRLFRPLSEGYFAGFPRKDYIEKQREILLQVMAEGKTHVEEEVDVYDDTFATSTWWNYWYHFNCYTRHQHGEGILGEVAPQCVLDAFSRMASPPPAFVEVGTMCGEIISRMARNAPKTRFYGVDRQVSLKRLNEEAYRLPNLEFVAADVLEFMHENAADLKDGMLFHCRTSPFLYPAFLLKMYETANRCGMKYISLLEAYTLSYETKEFRSFEQMDTPAEIRGGGLIHHNYPMVLEQAGFRIVEQEILPPTMLFTGMDSSVFIVAERIAKKTKASLARSR